MAKYTKGQTLRIRDGIEDSRLCGVLCKVFQVDEEGPKPTYMIEFHDGAVLDWKDVGVYFWIAEDNLEEPLKEE